MTIPYEFHLLPIKILIIVSGVIAFVFYGQIVLLEF